MKLSVLFTGLVVFAVVVDFSLAGGVQVTKNVLAAHECEAFARHAASSTTKQDGSDPGPRLQSYTNLSLELADHMHQTLHPYKGFRHSSGGALDDKMQAITSTITATTPLHQDRYRNGRLASEQVGFVVLNTNPDAVFVHGQDEDEQQVPVQKGSLVMFQGDVPHHTIVRSGHVHLLGPFAMSSFLPVGGGDDDDADECPDCKVCKYGFACSCLYDFEGDENDSGGGQGDDIISSICSNSKSSKTGSTTSKGGKGSGPMCEAYSGCDSSSYDDDSGCIGSCEHCRYQEFSCECCDSDGSEGGRRVLSGKSSKGVCRAEVGKGGSEDCSSG